VPSSSRQQGKAGRVLPCRPSSNLGWRWRSAAEGLRLSSRLVWVRQPRFRPATSTWLIPSSATSSVSSRTSRGRGPPARSDLASAIARRSAPPRPTAARRSSAWSNGNLGRGPLRSTTSSPSRCISASGLPSSSSALLAVSCSAENWLYEAAPSLSTRLHRQRRSPAANSEERESSR